MDHTSTPKLPAELNIRLEYNHTFSASVAFNFNSTMKAFMAMEGVCRGPNDPQVSDTHLLVKNLLEHLGL